jgi:hypothetical protein
MRSRSPLAASPESADDRREPSLAQHGSTVAPRLVPPDRGLSPRAAVRAPSAPQFELRAGERAVIASYGATAAPGELGLLLKKLGLAALALLALVGAVALLRPLVGF